MRHLTAVTTLTATRAMTNRTIRAVNQQDDNVVGLTSVLNAH